MNNNAAKIKVVFDDTSFFQGEKSLITNNNASNKCINSKIKVVFNFDEEKHDVNKEDQCENIEVMSYNVVDEISVTDTTIDSNTINTINTINNNTIIDNKKSNIRIIFDLDEFNEEDQIKKKKDEKKKKDKKERNKEKEKDKDKDKEKDENKEVKLIKNNDMQGKDVWNWVSIFNDSNNVTTNSTKNNSTSMSTNTNSSNTDDIPLFLEGEIEYEDSVQRQVVYPVTNGVMLAEEYKKGPYKNQQVDPTGWWASEKYDGIRVLWDGISLWTRAMNQINAPIWFQSRLPPNISLDGELFIKRNYFNETSGIIRNKIPNPDDWSPIVFMVFDIPHLGNVYPFEKRLEILKEIVNQYGDPLNYVNHIKIKNSVHLESIHNDLVRNGAEGTMIRAPNSYYTAGRSKSLLKIKEQYDATCIVKGWEEGKNKNTGRLGALIVSWEDPQSVWEEYGDPSTDTPYYGEFKAGSGLTDYDRVLLSDAPKAFPVGLQVKVAFTQLQKSGKPKHPAYKGKI